MLYTNDEFDEVYPVRELKRSLREVSFYRRPSDYRWTVWQVTHLAKVSSVPGRVDLDVMRGG